LFPISRDPPEGGTMWADDYDVDRIYVSNF